LALRSLCFSGGLGKRNKTLFMALGAGKYDDLCTRARKAAGAQGAILIVIEGRHGMGFSVQAEPNVVLQLPTILRKVADMIALDTERDAELKREFYSQ
jgi:hypothetical protein